MNRYEIEVTFKRPKFHDRAYKTKIKFNYNDDTFQECEGMIRDILKEVADKFINEEFYS